MPWVIEILHTINPTYVRFTIQVGIYQDAWDQLDECADYLASCLDINDNFVVNDEDENHENVDFYVVFCTQPIHVVKEDFIDAWNTNSRASDTIVAGTYYQKWGRGEISYMCFYKILQQCFYMFPMLNPSKFSMLPSNHRTYGNEVICMLLDYSLCGIVQALVTLGVDND